ncbi:MAG: hypothetical protein ACRECE_13245 [Xanthobacteraceae bacterium]
MDPDTYRRARVKATERDTSVSALVKQFLIDFAADESAADRLMREERELRERVRNFRVGTRLSREQVHDRRR